MKQLTCEMCGSTDLMKQDGVFVCQTCGTKYSVEEAKRMMIEGTVDVQGMVKIDGSGELENLYQIARRAKDENNIENAAKYYELILVKEPNSWEASFYAVYFKGLNCRIAEIANACDTVKETLNTIFNLIDDNVSDEEKKYACIEVAERVIVFSDIMFKSAKDFYENTDSSKMDWVTRADAAITLKYWLGVCLSYFDLGDTLNTWTISACKQGVEMMQSVGEIWEAEHSNLPQAKNFLESHREIVREMVKIIKKYEPSYVTPPENVPPKNGCYVATCVYGSYDCPEVWTLRRYRDYTLAETWYGRAFVKTYYAISPTLVKWFGHTKWFKKMWKRKLDRMVSKLKADGVDSTPYEDRNW